MPTGTNTLVKQAYSDEQYLSVKHPRRKKELQDFTTEANPWIKATRQSRNVDVVVTDSSEKKPISINVVESKKKNTILKK